MIARLRRSFAFWRERDRIIEDMQTGLYTVKQTMRRLELHGKPGGRERVHVWSCREGYLPCSCQFKFDFDSKAQVAMEAAYDFAEKVGGSHD